MELRRKSQHQKNSNCDLKPTCDPYVFIEEIRYGYVRYRNLDGERWEVIGVCTGIGKCFEGAVGEKPTLDCPVRKGFKNNCCPLQIVELPHGDKIIFS
jgi:hypothetical protein